MRKLFVLMALLIGVTIGSASSCRRTGNEQRFDLTGKVVSVDLDQQQVTISHEEVKGYMPAMTMPFKLPDPQTLSHIQGGDNITATLVVDGSKVWLEQVITSRQSTISTGPTTVVEPGTGDEVPDFQLINQAGKNIRLQEYRGKTVLLTFIYTRCPIPEYCTLMSTNFRDADRELQKNPDLYAKTHFLSISIDPEYDTPAVLKSYGAAHTERYQDETFAHWEFATGSKEQIKLIAGYFGLTYVPESDQIIHNLRTVIVGPDGKVKKVYRDNKWKPEEVVNDIQQVLVQR